MKFAIIFDDYTAFQTAMQAVNDAGGISAPQVVQEQPQQQFTPPAQEHAVSAPMVSGAELDADGLPWDERINAKAKTKTAKGVWKIGKGLDKDMVAAVKAELKSKYSGIEIPPTQQPMQQPQQPQQPQQQFTPPTQQPMQQQFTPPTQQQPQQPQPGFSAPAGQGGFNPQQQQPMQQFTPPAQQPMQQPQQDGTPWETARSDIDYQRMMDQLNAAASDPNFPISFQDFPTLCGEIGVQNWQQCQSDDPRKMGYIFTRCGGQ